MLALGFALGIYFLPILTAPPSPDGSEIEAQAAGALFVASFDRDRQGSDFLHWGEGQLSVTERAIVHEGKLAPGPDYKLYLMTQFVEDEAGFEAARAEALQIGDIKSFGGFVVPVPDGVDVRQYSTVVVWCESFGEFITSAQYQ
ncbi:DM13 domain-containing protein [Cognatishimia sp. SS12]|uniref:DM13 domain-containing protein n=1 Tax=Cognatishimia sp. SS12 TaxID=2979465 RepID=UPI00232F7544|nr:DM13 domain-containing protein [Cognatishimia sp. SS12]MDC0738750.1 DM13 domain-containing protein [Cognatishimia sp. SS12]